MYLWEQFPRLSYSGIIIIGLEEGEEERDTTKRVSSGNKNLNLHDDAYQKSPVSSVVPTLKSSNEVARMGHSLWFIPTHFSKFQDKEVGRPHGNKTSPFRLTDGPLPAANFEDFLCFFNELYPPSPSHHHLSLLSFRVPVSHQDQMRTSHCRLRVRTRNHTSIQRSQSGRPTYWSTMKLTGQSM